MENSGPPSGTGLLANKQWFGLDGPSGAIDQYFRPGGGMLTSSVLGPISSQGSMRDE